METNIGARLIETLTAALYSEPIILFREYVQNSVDSFQANHKNFQKKDFKITIDIDKDRHNIEITDNGFGIARSDFLTEMTSISNSHKKKSNNQIGFKGIGRLSGLPFCEKLIFKNKPDKDDSIQVFSWDAKKYFLLLNSNPNEPLETCIAKIVEKETISNIKDSSNERFFSVELKNINEELFNIIYDKNGDISKSFVRELCLLLPVPYDNNFSFGEDIKKQYFSFFGKNIEDYEYTIYLNKEQLFKPYNNTDIKNNDIHFISYHFPNDLDSKESKIGLLWFSFDYVFKAYSEDYGISVRSKNMLVNKQQVFADECSKSQESPTTYTQLVNGIKCIKGEFLIDSSLLRDNSKRDWFIYDKFGLFLRVIIVDFMKKLNNYRRTASRFFNSEKNTEQQKENLIKVFNEFINEQETMPLYRKKIEELAPKSNSDNEDDCFFVIDELEQLKNSLSYESINILKIIFEELYNYFKKKNKKEDFYKLKQKIIENVKGIEKKEFEEIIL